MIQQFSIEYCVPCQFEEQANKLVKVIQPQFGLKDEQIELIASNKIGTFEVTANGVLIYSKKKSGHLPQPDEIINLIFAL